LKGPNEQLRFKDESRTQYRFKHPFARIRSLRAPCS
jgi:hypothetical protein